MLELPKVPSCYFCDIISGTEDRWNVIEQTAEVLVVLNGRQFEEGQCVVTPVRHAPTLLDLSETEIAAVMAAAQPELGRIVAFIDKNDMCMDGPQDEVMQVNPVDEKFEAFGWNAVNVDGHDMAALVDVIDQLPDPTGDRPTVIVAQTVKGRGVGFMENVTNWHSGTIDDEVLEQCYEELDERAQAAKAVTP